MGSVSLGWIVLGVVNLLEPRRWSEIVLGVVNVITYTADRLILTVLCRVESTFEGGWMAFAV